MRASDKMPGPQQNMPGQFHDGWSSNEDLLSIRRLMLAILQDALECLAGCAVRPGGLNTRTSAQDAALWIADTNEREIFSFNSVCYVLGLDAAAVRKALIDLPISGLRMLRRSPVAREPVKLSLAAYRKRDPNMRRAANSRASSKG